MTLTELQYIVAVAQEHHFGRAAERVFVTQPALSLAVKKLEEELGATIFERRRSRIVLTSTGERILYQAQRVLEEADRIKQIAAQGKDQLVGLFRLGVIATVGPYILPDLVSLLHTRAPAMPLEIEENLTASLTTMLKNGKLDAIIISFPFDEPGITAYPIYEEVFKLVLPPGHAWAKKKSIDPKKLGSEKVLLPHAGHCFRIQVLEACPELSRSDAEGMQGNSLETIRQMVASGLGITVLPCSALTPRYHNKRLTVVSFVNPVPARQIGLAWRKGFVRPDALKAIAGSIRALRIPGLDVLPSSKHDALGSLT